MVDLMDFGISAANRRRRARSSGGGGTIPTAPTPTPTTGGGTSGGTGGTTGTGSTGTSSGTSSSGSSGSSSSSGSSGHKGPRQNTWTTSGNSWSDGNGGGHGGGGDGGGGGSAEAKAARRYMQQAQTIQLQVEAVQAALGGEFKSALKRRLRNVRHSAKTQEDTLMGAYEARVSDLEKTAKDNEAATDQLNFQNLTNAGRERANAVSQATLQGAGESDLLQSQMMSLRNWSSNQNDISRNAADTNRSILSSLTDVTQDTKTARINNQLQKNSDMEQLWNDYYDQREQAQIQLGNLYGQQAELYGYANEAKGSKKARRKMKKAQQASGSAFMHGAHLAGEAWKDPGVRDDVENWGGITDVKAHPPIPRNFSYDAEDAPAPPSGASLRKWA